MARRDGCRGSGFSLAGTTLALGESKTLQQRRCAACGGMHVDAERSSPKNGSNLARKLRALEQVELATKAGLPPTSISHFEAGSRKPSFDNLRRLAQALDVASDYLMGRTNEPGMTTASDQLYRDIQKLTDEDRELAKDFLALLANRKQTMAQKNENEIGLIQARHHGEVNATEFGFTALPIDLLEIASKVGIVVQAKKTTGGVSGMLLRNGDNFGILYATHIQSPGFQRFSIAHELGHYFLPGHIDAVLGDRHIHESRAGFASGDKYEMEADYFAAGLLMPQQFFIPAMRQAGEGLAAIKYLANLCETSLTATAIRFAQCSREPVAIVVSTGNSIDYCFMSDALRDIYGIDWIRKRAPLPRNTPTFAFNQDSGKIRQAAQVEATSNFQDWFGGRLNIEIRE